MELRTGKIYLTKFITICIILSGVAKPVFSQSVANEVNGNTESIRLFMDCQGCDMTYIREEMPYVNYVRDVTEAQVYLMITRQNTGSGGYNFNLYYSGQEEFAGMTDTLFHTTGPDDTNDIVREGLTNTIAMGLIRYIVKTPVRNSVLVRPASTTRQVSTQVEDKWDSWVFELQTTPRFSIEKSVESYSWNNTVEADRVTEDWKFNFDINQSYSKNIYIRERTDNETHETTVTRTEAVRSSWGFSNLSVMSISDHMSLGLRANASSSTYDNLQLRLRLAPAFEYNLFPYSQSTRKQLRVVYTLGFIYNNYQDTTVYNQISEGLISQSLNIALRVQQRWGSANLSLGGSNYMHDFSKNQLSMSGNISIRVFKGFSLSVNGGASFIRDQITLAKGDVSEEDLYLRLRALQTSYRYNGSVGLSYTFGSIYNNVVNPRL